jgi:prevent-host-death family protein
MRTIAVFEAENRFSELISAAEHGEEITITRHGNPVARLISFAAHGQAPDGQRERVQGALQRLRNLSQAAELGVPLAQAVESGRD